MYIHERPHWPDLHWDNEKLSSLLAQVHHQQGYLLGQMNNLGFDIQAEACLEVLAADVTKSSQIEGEILDLDLVRSSLARRLGMDIGGVSATDRYVEGTVEMMLDATQGYQKPLTTERLFAWHCALFPTKHSGLYPIDVGAWRSSSVGPMQVVSGPMGREKVHFEAPAAELLEKEMQIFLDWFNHSEGIDPVLKAGVAHFWFVTIHPFEDGNGRIARAIADMCLARADGIQQRFYSMSSSIELQRQQYYQVLESSQKGKLDITEWLEWFLTCLSHAVNEADNVLEKVLYKARIWQILNQHPINARQRKVVNLLLEEAFRSKLTTSKYAKVAKCSQDTALRDIQTLISYGVMEKNPSSGRSTSYQLVLLKE